MVIQKHSTDFARGLVPEIDGLRGIAILLVLVHRLWPRTGTLARYASIPELGWVGVDLFFVISGLLIAGILLDTREDAGYYKNFYARRALRIFPLYYAFVGLVFLAFPLMEGGAYLRTAFIGETGSPLYYFLYLGNIPESVLGKDPPYVIAPVWSLAIEEQFYITFPFLVATLTRRNLTRVLVALALFAPLLRLASTIAWPERERLQYQFTLCRVDVIAVGALLAVGVRTNGFVERYRRHAPRMAWAALIVLGITIALGGLDRTMMFGRVVGYSVVAGGFGTLAFWTVMQRGTRATSLLRSSPLKYMGKLCYGLYLLHRPADVMVTKALARTPWPHIAETVAGVALKMGVAIGLAALSWRFFEKPILVFKRRFDSRRHPMAEHERLSARRR